LTHETKPPYPEKNFKIPTIGKSTTVYSRCQEKKEKFLKNFSVFTECTVFDAFFSLRALRSQQLVFLIQQVKEHLGCVPGVRRIEPSTEKSAKQKAKNQVLAFSHRFLNCVAIAILGLRPPGFGLRR